MAEISQLKQEQHSGQRLQYVVFQLGNEDYALEINEIKEVVLTPQITKVPWVPDYILGIATIRGSILAVVDLEVRFGKASSFSKTMEGSYSMVLSRQDAKVGVLVSSVPKTLAVYESQIDFSPEIIQSSLFGRNFIKGIIQHNGRLILLLAIDQVISKLDIQKATDNSPK